MGILGLNWAKIGPKLVQNWPKIAKNTLLGTQSQLGPKRLLMLLLMLLLILLLMLLLMMLLMQLLAYVIVHMVAYLITYAGA